MASKKDLVAAQTFSRRRLLTAFVSGAPGGMELEPTKPLRAVVTGIALTVLLVLGSLGLGMLKPGLQAGWDDNTLVIATDGGSRYVALDGTLYPVLNTASARLLITGGFRVVEVTSAQIADAPRGPMVGIVGAPDALPSPEHLIADGWMACVGPTGGMTTVLSAGQEVAAARAAVERRPTSADPPPGLLVTSAGELYLVTEGRRHLIHPGGQDAVLRALDLPTVTPWPVTASWLNLFTPGSDLEPLEVPGAGDPVPNPMAAPPGAVVGSVLRVTDGGDTADVFIIDADGDLVPMSDVALRLYRLGSGDGVGVDTEVFSAQVQGMGTAREPVAPADWPTALSAPLPAGEVACAYLSIDGDDPNEPTAVHLVGSADLEVPDDGVTRQVDPAGGALVVPLAGGTEAAGYVQLIDATGTSYPLPGADEDVLSRLEYEVDDVVTVPQPWVALFAPGPELTIAAAQLPHVPGPGAADATANPGEECDPGTPRYVADPPSVLTRLAVDAAWEIATGAGVTVAVVDSGVDRGNVHLTDAVLPGIDLVSDDADGWTDVAGHGTAIAGQIAARPAPDHESGMIGIAPEAMILPVRVYDADTEQTREAGTAPRNDRVAEGIRYAAEQGAQVINVSISSTVDDAVLRDAVRFATDQGSLVVASAGNRLTTDDPTDSARFPAAYPEVLAVTVVGEGDVTTDAAIHGPHIDIAGPGTNVLTTFFAAGDCVLAGDNPSTSFATGYVSAAAALVAERYPHETPEQWAYRLTVTAARPQADARNDLLGWGVVRPYAALAFVDDGTAPGPPSPAFPAPEDDPPAIGPIPLSDSADALSATRDASVWWGLGGAAAVVGATLLSIPGVRRRGAGNRAEPRSQTIGQVGVNR